MAQDHPIAHHAKNSMTGAIDHLKGELRSIRAGRASSAIIEGVSIEVYGSQMKIKELGTITSPESRQLVITPFDGTHAGLISKAIEKANLGVRSVVEGKSIRIFFPELDQNRRKELVSQTHKRREESKLAIRNVRRDANELLKKLKTVGEIPEDDLKKLEKQVQDLTDKFCKEADDVTLVKEKEIMTV
ncbi:MAG: ribosome recycling factor [Chlamydia sp.]